MAETLYLGTGNGVAVCTRQHGAELDGAWKLVRRVLEGHEVTSLSAGGGSMLAGTPHGIWRSSDGGQTWAAADQGLDVHHVRVLAHHPELPEMVFAGTEPAAIFISYDGGQTWQSRPEVVELRQGQRWYLPYSPEAGCVRGFAFLGQRAYAAVEVGGMLISSNGGETWRLLQSARTETDRLPHWVALHPDVHTVLVHASSPDMIFAPTGGGFFRSVDGGRTWRRLYTGYARAAWIDPQDSDHILLGPAESVDRNGKIVVSRDGGKNWGDAAAGLVVPWKRHQVERFVEAGAHLLGILSNGELIETRLGQKPLTWRVVLPEVKNVRTAIFFTSTA